MLLWLQRWCSAWTTKNDMADLIDLEFDGKSGDQDGSSTWSSEKFWDDVRCLFFFNTSFRAIAFQPLFNGYTCYNVTTVYVCCTQTSLFIATKVLDHSARQKNNLNWPHGWSESPAFKHFWGFTPIGSMENGKFYLHESLILMVNVGMYIPYMNGMGYIYLVRKINV